MLQMQTKVDESLNVQSQVWKSHVQLLCSRQRQVYGLWFKGTLATVSKNRSKIRNVCQILLCCLKGNKVIQGWTNTLSCCTVSEMILGITNDVLQNSFSKLLNRGAKNTVNFCSSALMESYNMLDKTQRDKLRERQ